MTVKYTFTFSGWVDANIIRAIEALRKEDRASLTNYDQQRLSALLMEAHQRRLTV